MTKITSDLTKYQAQSIETWQFDMEEMRKIEPKDEVAKAALNKFINRNGAPIDVHRTNGRRVFNPFTAMKRSHRKFVSHNGLPLIEIDAANSHPLIMVFKMIEQGLEVENDIKVAVESGTFYDYLLEDGLTRSEVKESWFSFCYAKEINKKHKVFNRLNSVFPLFIQSFTEYIQGKNLSEYLQELESNIWIDKISMALMRSDINHITIHDSVVFAGVQHINKVLDIIHAAFNDLSPNLHIDYLNGEKVDFKRVTDPDNAKYLDSDYLLIDELDKCKANPWLTVERPETAVYMIDNGERFPLLTTGNFSAFSGKSKSGKTLLISAIVASVLSGRAILDKFQGSLPSEKSNILYFDTEMAEYDLQWVMKRVLSMAGITEKQELNITFYRLREKDTNKRNELIDVALRKAKNVGMIIIDGIRDIVKDINNAEESTLAINNIMRWTDVYKLHLIAVLHQNPGKETGNKLRGHIGTEAMNKAEAVISIIKQDGADYSMVNSDFMRRDAFEAFGIQYNKETNLPELINEVTTELKKVVNPWDISPTEHMVIIDKIFSIQDKFTKKEFLTKGKDLMMMMKYDISRRAFDTIFDYWNEENVLNEVKHQNTKYITKNQHETDLF